MVGTTYGDPTAQEGTGVLQSNRAVSPVIGVILMVAITVILAAVIGAFVLEIGDQQETAPNTSFDSDQQTIFLDYWTGGSRAATLNATQVTISHAGGSVLDVSQIQVKVEGNESTWGLEENALGPGSGTDPAEPVPDIRPTFGSNEAAEFSSGQSWNLLGANKRGPPRERIDDLYNNIDGFQLKYDSDSPVLTYNHDSNGWQSRDLHALETGNAVRVVWTASSGGKTQTLFQYSVQ